jgi:hypothetical protein
MNGKRNRMQGKIVERKRRAQERRKEKEDEETGVGCSAIELCFVGFFVTAHAVEEAKGSATNVRDGRMDEKGIPERAGKPEATKKRETNRSKIRGGKDKEGRKHTKRSEEKRECEGDT